MSNIKNRLEDISFLKDGWLNGEGKKFDKEKLKELEEKFKDFEPIPYIYPMEDGSLSLEWDIRDWGISFKLNLNMRIGYFEAYNYKTGATKSEDISVFHNTKYLENILKKLS